jgi:hypothetical protein
MMTEKDRDVSLNLNEETERGAGRTEDRYAANAQVKILEDELLLKNISSHGGQVQGGELVDIIPNGKYTIAITPEKESDIDKFEVEILSKWVKIKRSGTEAGFIMVLPPGSGAVEKYIAYLKKKSVQAE